MSSPENTKSLADVLGPWGFTPDRRRAMGQALLNGPLSDLSVLVQIPAVRELITQCSWLLVDLHSHLADQWTDDEQRNFVAWLDALDATA